MEQNDDDSTISGIVDPKTARRWLDDLGLEVSDFEELQGEGLLSSMQLPTLKYGYAKSPLSWDQLQEIILVEKDLAKLSRSSVQQREYEIFKHCLKKQYESVLDHILITKFDFDCQKNANGLWQAFQSLKDPSTTVQTRLIPNDFPYSMADGIVHYIFWKTKESVTTQDIEAAKLELRQKLPVVDLLHWTNPPHLQSLPDIDHVHILCRLSTTGEDY